MTSTSSNTTLVNIIAGSTGAGKTTYTRGLASRIGGVRFSIDDWMTTLFWMDSPQPIQYTWAIERITRCETVIFDNVRQLAAMEIPTVLDLGFTKADHRKKFAVLAQEAGLAVQLHWLDVPADERWIRVQQRNAEKGETFRMNVDREMFDFMEDIWEPPMPSEMQSMNGVRVT
jgi:predicted kinase